MTTIYVPRPFGGTLILTVGTNQKDLTTRFSLMVQRVRDVLTRFRVLALGTRDMGIRFRVTTSPLRDISGRFPLQVTPSTGIMLSPLPVTTPFLGGGNILPVYAPQLIYSVGGILLDSQPYIATAPSSTSGVLPVGSAFVLLFASPSSATQTALANGRQVSLTFGLADGEKVTGQVQLTSVLTGVTFQVVVTLLQSVSVL